MEVGRENCLFIHVTLIPYIASSGEYKSKPTQHSVKELQSIGITPNIVIVRCDERISDELKEKIALFCNVKRDCVIQNITLPILYKAPIMLEEENLSAIVCRELHLTAGRSTSRLAGLLSAAKNVGTRRFCTRRQ